MKINAQMYIRGVDGFVYGLCEGYEVVPLSREEFIHDLTKEHLHDIMINQILKQLGSKPIPIKLWDDNTFSGNVEVELKDFIIDFYLEASATFSKPEPTTLEHYYAGGDLEDCDIDISDIVVFDSNGYQVYMTFGDYPKVLKLIENNIEFE